MSTRAQPQLPLKVGLLYECMNPKCFYVGALLKASDVVWKHFWNTNIEDLDLRATCPSCSEPMAIWKGGDD